MGTSLYDLEDDEELRRQQEADNLDQEAEQTPPDLESPEPEGGFGGQVSEQGGEPQQVLSSPGGVSTVPPPPPPPPPPPDFSELGGNIAQYPQDWLDQPNRYLGPLATATRRESEARLSKAEQDEIRKTEEWAQSRGLLGSSYEGEQRTALSEGLQRARNEDEARLLEMLASAETEDRRAAIQNALEAARYGETSGLERYRAGLEGYRAGEESRIAQADIDLRAEQIQQQASQFGREIDFRTAQAEAERQLERERLEMERELEGGRLGLSREELAQRESQFTRGLTEQQAARLQGAGFTQQELDQEAQRLMQGD